MTKASSGILLERFSKLYTWTSVVTVRSTEELRAVTVLSWGSSEWEKSLMGVYLETPAEPSNHICFLILPIFKHFCFVIPCRCLRCCCQEIPAGEELSWAAWDAPLGMAAALPCCWGIYRNVWATARCDWRREGGRRSVLGGWVKSWRLWLTATSPCLLPSL